MSPILHHESTRVPVTSLASCGALLIAAEGPYLRIYHTESSRFIASRRVFKSQAVHGICVYAEESNVTKVVVWGGRLVCALQINTSSKDCSQEPLSLNLSNVVKAPDWILDLAPRSSSLEFEAVHGQGVCAAVTAHNALLELIIQWQNGDAFSPFTLELAELTTSSRSILYSAHLLWESSGCILVAAGTAFGEIMYWSWNKSAKGKPTSCIHRVFFGHEGSIFDVRISKELQRGCCASLKRVIASCSDDRTIRLWDVSSVDVNVVEPEAVDQGAEAQRTRHTGFRVAATDSQSDNSNCLAIGWGHTSRVWKVRFLDSPSCGGSLALLSAGEDATSRTWKLVASTGKQGNLPYMIQQVDCAAYHSGKNMWSMTTYDRTAGPTHIACGAADSKLTNYPLLGIDRNEDNNGGSCTEYSVQDLFLMAQPSIPIEATRQHGKTADSIRSYCCILDRCFLLVTNSGKVLMESFGSDTDYALRSSLTTSTLIGQIEELSGYSTCTGISAYGVAFLAGTKGSIFMTSAAEPTLRIVHTVTGKVGSLFTTGTSSVNGRKRLALLITLVGQRHAELLFIDLATSSSQLSLKALHVPLSNILTGPTITSMLVIELDSRNLVLFLGFRHGSIGVYHVSHDVANSEAQLFRVLEKAHGDETVNAMKFQATPERNTVGHLYSVGRDSCLAVHWIDVVKNTTQLVHNLILPIGPNVEDLYFLNDHLLLHGFSSKKWLLYDITSEKEIMGIETGGAHRSWAFQPSSDSRHAQPGGTLLWTRASSLHIYCQEGPSHEVFRSGGHGREIKAVAISSPVSCSQRSESRRRLIATGAEDTDIRIFEYIGDELVCRTTMRRHTTGIQHLEWSDDGEYLFSSAGSEEFYIWRVRALDAVIDIGVVCEYVYVPESESSDLRIMSFDVARRGKAFMIAMVFSDSSVKTYCYDPRLAMKWQPLSKGVYYTSCLTQCILLSPTNLLTAGTDGHVALWSLSDGASNQDLKWQDPTRIHQNASKTMSSQANSDGTSMIVSGGDDGALAFLHVHGTRPNLPSVVQEPYASPPVLVNRAHGSAVTACAIFKIRSHTYVLTSGNDEWVRLWEVVINKLDYDDVTKGPSDKLTIKRLSKIKTSVADVSSMAVLDDDDKAARVLLCGVGMEVILVDLSSEQA